MSRSASTSRVLSSTHRFTHFLSSKYISWKAECEINFSSSFHVPIISLKNKKKICSAETTESELCRVFSAYGNVKSTKIIVDRAGVSKGYGFVTFETELEASRLHDVRCCKFNSNYFKYLYIYSDWRVAVWFYVIEN